MKERIGYFDFLRGMAILMVIGIHSYHVVPFDSAINITRNIARELISFAVPLFLAISGYFIGCKSISDNKDYIAFVKKQIPRVYLPMLLWSLPALGLSIVMGAKTGHAILKLFSFSTFGPYYFVFLIIQFYLLHPLFMRVADSRWGG